MEKPVFDSIAEAEFQQDPEAYGDRNVYTVQYKKLFEDPDGKLAVARRVGWDSKAGSSHRYSIIHIPTRTDLGVMFSSEATAREFVDEIAKEWDWDFDNMGDARIEQDKLFRLAGKLNGLNFLGQPILSNAGKE